MPECHRRVRGRAREMDLVKAATLGMRGRLLAELDPLLPKRRPAFAVGRAFYTPEIFVESWFGV